MSKEEMTKQCIATMELANKNSINLLNLLEEKDQEIERLNKELQEFKDGRIEPDELVKMLNQELVLENERLNNIINEFESWLIGWIENEQYCFMSNNPKDRCRREVYEEVLHHFKELKGSGK